MLSKPCGKGREKSAVASSMTEDLGNPEAENPEAGKERDQPSTVPSMEVPQPDDPAIESLIDVGESQNVLKQKRRKTQTDLAKISINTSVHV